MVKPDPFKGRCLGTVPFHQLEINDMCMRDLYAFVRVYGNADEVLAVCATEPYINKETM
jgi:hypothetical protein